MNKNSAANILLTTCSDCKIDENILIVTDPESYEVAKILWDAIEAYPNRTLVMMSARTMHGQQPPASVASAMFKADVIFGCTKFSLFHSQARKDAVANGARFVNMVDYSPEMLKSGGLFCDFEEIGKVCSKVADTLTGKKTCRITTANGTDFTCSIENRKPFAQYGRSLNKGVSSSPPDIECATCAVEGTANGVVYIDGSIPHPLLGLITDEIKLTIKDGKICDITGGKQAEIFRDLLKSFNDPNVYYIGEIGFGLNPKCELSGRMLEDEGCGGTIHLACGDNMGFGGTVQCPYHIDMIFREPTAYADDICILQNGKLCI